MRKLIVGIIAGIVLGSTSLATAAELGGWRYMATEVKCKGGESVVCYSSSDENLYGRDYSVYFSRCSVEVWRSRADSSQQTVFSRWQPYCD